MEPRFFQRASDFFHAFGRITSRTRSGCFVEANPSTVRASTLTAFTIAFSQNRDIGSSSPKSTSAAAEARTCS